MNGYPLYLSVNCTFNAYYAYTQNLFGYVSLFGLRFSSLKANEIENDEENGVIMYTYQQVTDITFKYNYQIKDKLDLRRDKIINQ